MRYLLDTNVISELVARKPNPRVIHWVESIAEDLLYLSVITVGEIQKGIEKLPDTPRRAILQAWLQNDLLERFSQRVQILDIDVLLEWGKLTAHLEAVEKPLPAIDALIAASALHGEFILVTRNTQDFIATGVQVLDPWEFTG